MGILCKKKIKNAHSVQIHALFPLRKSREVTSLRDFSLREYSGHCNEPRENREIYMVSELSSEGRYENVMNYEKFLHELLFSNPLPDLKFRQRLGPRVAQLFAGNSPFDPQTATLCCRLLPFWQQIRKQQHFFCFGLNYQGSA